MSFRRWFGRLRTARVPALLPQLRPARPGPSFSLIAPERAAEPGLAEHGIEVVANLGAARGDFAVFLAADDQLAADALARLGAALQQDPSADVVYADHAEPDGEPFHKPGWSPALLLAQPYALGLIAYRRDLLARIGGPDAAAGGAWDYDLALRATAAARRVLAVPHLLLRRTTPRPVDPAADTAAAAAAAARLGLQATFAATPDPAVRRVSLRPRTRPAVTIVVPTRDRLDLVKPAVDSVLQRTAYPEFTVLVVDNGSREPATLEQFAAWTRTGRVRVRRDDIPFDYSALMNRAAAEVDTPLLLLLNNDTEVIAPHWLDELVAWSELPDTGAVGAKLLYADGTIQHAGVLLGIGGVASHGHKGFAGDAAGYRGLLHCVRDCSAVTGACLLTKTALYREVGGLEPELRVAFNDVDYCLKLRARGQRVLWTPLAELHHYEGKSRGDDRRGQGRFEREIAWMQARWGPLLQNDPFYNPNLSLRATDYRRR